MSRLDTKLVWLRHDDASMLGHCYDGNGRPVCSDTRSRLSLVQTYGRQNERCRRCSRCLAALRRGLANVKRALA